MAAALRPVRLPGFVTTRMLEARAALLQQRCYEVSTAQAYSWGGLFKVEKKEETLTPEQQVGSHCLVFFLFVFFLPFTVLPAASLRPPPPPPTGTPCHG